MKGFFCVFLLTLVLSLANASHKKHKATKTEAEATGGDVPTNEQWPNPSAVGGFSVPEGFAQGSMNNEGGSQAVSDTAEESSGAEKHHGKSKHAKHSH